MKLFDTLTHHGVTITKIGNGALYENGGTNPNWEVDIPDGWEYDGCHSLLSDSLAGARDDAENVARGPLNQCDGTQGCE
jgi:hypothetical protein